MNVTEVTKELIKRVSVTPNDAGCMDWIVDYLAPFNIRVESFDKNEVKNVLVSHGTGAPHFVFLGHTDVVPVGNESDWLYDPFTPTIVGDLMYGRGTADMKGSIAAFIEAFKAFVTEHPNHPGTVSLLLTSDEEGPADFGIRYVATELEKRDITLDYCLVGEPSSTEKLGDVVKVGRRGSLGGSLVIHGRQGHVAYPHLAENPIHSSARFIDKITKHRWDSGNEYFPPTSFQISNISAGTGATNVIPGDLAIEFNFRYSTEVTHEALKSFTESLLEQEALDYSIKWKLNGEPFLTDHGRLVEAVVESISTSCGYPPELSTSGGTSDGRFIAPLGVEVVELGPINATIHQVNECVSVSDLEQLAIIYRSIIKKILLK